MRRLLDALYLMSGYVACLCLALIGASIVAQIAGRFVGAAFDATEISGFFMAASTFLGLAYTFRAGSHVRVTLIVGRLGPAGQRGAELWSYGIAAVACAYWAWQTIEMVVVSIELHDISPGLMAVPFWIPQSLVALGIIVLTIGLADEFCQVLGGKTPEFTDAEAQAIGDIEAEPLEQPAPTGVAR